MVKNHKCTWGHGEGGGTTCQICHLFLNSLKHVLHSPPHTVNTFCLLTSWPHVFVQQFSKMHLLRREARGKGTSKQNAQDLLGHRVLGKQKWHKTWGNSLLEQVPADFCIHGAEGIVQEVDVCIMIHGSRKQKRYQTARHFISESQQCSTIQMMFIPKPRKWSRTSASLSTDTQWGVCAVATPRSKPKRHVQNDHQNGIYLARLTRAFCPPLSVAPRSPITVRSPSSKSSKSYIEKPGGERLKMCSPTVILNFQH